ncbi:hypothetical protein Tco_0610504 [Tanacetum coccineum]
MSQSLSCIGKILSTIGKGRIYKYGGHHNYKCVKTHVDLAILFAQICVDTLGSYTAAPRGGRTGIRTGRGGGRTREPTSRVGGRTGDQDGQRGDQGNHASNIQGDVRDVNVGNGRIGFLYKEFMACNPKDYDGKGGKVIKVKKSKNDQKLTRNGKDKTTRKEQKRLKNCDKKRKDKTRVRVMK